LGVFGGCASIDLQPAYEPPREQTIPSSVVVDKPFDQAWAGFVRRLSSSFFEVNNISKESQFISISVHRNQAQDFIDCGRLSYKVGGKHWTFRPDQPGRYTGGSGFRATTVIDHDVKSYLGRMNVVIQPDGGGTLFEVNTSYAFAMQTTGRDEVRNLLGQVTNAEHLDPMQASFRFTSKAPDEQPFGPVTVRCQATGVWEQLILDLARRS